MKKMIFKRKCMSEDELRWWVKDVLKYTSTVFGCDNFIISGHTDEDFYVIVAVEKNENLKTLFFVGFDGQIHHANEFIWRGAI